jgi:hypothetical protein
VPDDREVPPETQSRKIPDLVGFDRMVIDMALPYGAKRGRVLDSEQNADGWLGLVAARN